MKLEFMYLPTRDLAASLSLYRDALGFDELWREGDETVGLAVPGTDAGDNPVYVMDQSREAVG